MSVVRDQHHFRHYKSFSLVKARVVNQFASIIVYSDGIINYYGRRRPEIEEEAVVFIEHCDCPVSVESTLGQVAILDHIPKSHLLQVKPLGVIYWRREDEPGIVCVVLYGSHVVSLVNKCFRRWHCFKFSFIVRKCDPVIVLSGPIHSSEAGGRPIRINPILFEFGIQGRVLRAY